MESLYRRLLFGDPFEVTLFYSLLFVSDSFRKLCSETFFQRPFFRGSFRMLFVGGSSSKAFFWGPFLRRSFLEAFFRRPFLGGTFSEAGSFSYDSGGHFLPMQ